MSYKEEQRINELREKFPKGTRIRLDHMDDPYHPVPSGTIGTVKSVDDGGTVHVTWDNGSSLGLIPEEDHFTVLQKPEMIKVIIVEPDNHPRVANISNDLESMQEIVGGMIEEVYIGDDAVIVCNEEGKLLGMEGNRQLGNDIIAGTFFIAGDDGGEEFASLSDEQIEKYTQKFYEIEDHSQQDMRELIGYGFFK